MSFYRVDPIRVFESNGEVCRLLCMPKTLVAGINQEVVAGITGKRIRVMGWMAQGSGAVGTYRFEDGSGGSVLAGPFTHPASTATPFDKPVIESGYFETTVETGLYAAVFTSTVVLCVFYIAYTP